MTGSHYLLILIKQNVDITPFARSVWCHCSYQLCTYTGFTTCKSLGVERALYNNSLVCSEEQDSVLGSVFGYFSDCAFSRILLLHHVIMHFKHCEFGVV